MEVRLIILKRTVWVNPEKNCKKLLWFKPEKDCEAGKLDYCCWWKGWTLASAACGREEACDRCMLVPVKRAQITLFLSDQRPAAFSILAVSESWFCNRVGLSICWVCTCLIPERKLLFMCDKVSKVGDHSRGWPEGSLFNSYYTEV